MVTDHSKAKYPLNCITCYTPNLVDAINRYAACMAMYLTSFTNGHALLLPRAHRISIPLHRLQNYSKNVCGLK